MDDSDYPERIPRKGLPKDLQDKIRDYVDIRENEIRNSIVEMRRQEEKRKLDNTHVDASEDSLFANMMRSDTKSSWLLNWERVEHHLYDQAPSDQKRAEVCAGCGKNRPSSNKAASLGIDIMGTSLCKKCVNEGYLARF